IDWNWLQVVAHIPKGQQIPKKSLAFDLATDGLSLGKPRLPAPEQGVYRGTVTFNLPVDYHIKRPASDLGVNLRMGYTVCNAQGDCSGRASKAFHLLIPAARRDATAGHEPQGSGFSGVLAELGHKLGLTGATSQRRFLTPDQAFALTTTAADGRTIVASWRIADGYYLYRKKFHFSIHKGDGVTLGQAVLPQGKPKVDENFGRMEVYYHQVAARIPVQRSASGPTHVVMTAHYQGCADAGFCYPPITKTVDFDLPAPGAGPGGAGAPVALSETDRIASSLATDNMGMTLLTFFGLGLLLAFTPCVFPMVPILSSIIVGQGRHITTRRAFTLSLVYVLPMAATYTAAGVVAALLGKNLQAVFQAPWIIVLFSAVFVLLALSMFGVYELQLPSRWQTKLNELSQRQRGGTLLGVAAMGLFSALIVGPCVAAPLAGTLLYIGQSHNVLVGGSALFALSLGMGTPLLAFGTSAGKLLPKAGPWMTGVKALFGVLLLGVAVWFLGRILPDAVTMALWAALLLVAAVYLGLFTRLEGDAAGWLKLRKGAGLIVGLYGILVLVGAASGGTDPLQPLQGLGLGAGRAESGAAPMKFVRVKGPHGLMQKLAAARRQGKPVMLDFYADWCVDCKKMERSTFANPRVQAQLSRYIVLQSDVTAYDHKDQALLNKFGLPGPPAILFFGQNGQERRRARLIGFTQPDAFIRHIRQASRS
ncbi:MAG TPA: protein-disulfide reductase DsbD, partial [Gammaproteobacteria bacterium]|nr:protein-disulfide reductase DsbD [Gammaproteobacteria bacterium]